MFARHAAGFLSALAVSSSPPRSTASLTAMMAAWSAALSTGISLAMIPPIFLNCGIGSPYWSSASRIAPISSSVKVAFPVRSSISDAMPNL